MSLITLKMQSKNIFYHILVSRLTPLIKVGVKTYFTNRKELTESFHLDNFSTHSCIQPERQSLKDLNPAKIPFHSSTDAIAYAIHLYTNATNFVCYVSTRNSLSHFYSSHGLQNTLVWCRLTWEQHFANYRTPAVKQEAAHLSNKGERAGRRRVNEVVLSGCDTQEVDVFGSGGARKWTAKGEWLLHLLLPDLLLLLQSFICTEKSPV